MKLGDLFKEEDSRAWKRGEREGRKKNVLHSWKSKITKLLSHRKKGEYRLLHGFPSPRPTLDDCNERNNILMDAAATNGSKSKDALVRPGREFTSNYSKARKSTSTVCTATIAESAVKASTSSGRNVEAASFNLGVGVGAFLLIAKRKYEFDRTMHLRMQMDTLLKNIKDTVRMTDVGSSSPKKDDCLPYPASNFNRFEGTKNHLPVKNGRPSKDSSKMQFAMRCNQESNFSSTSNSLTSVGRDEMEAELEAELELLQLRLDAEKLEQQSIEMVVENIAPLGRRSFSARSVKEYDTQQAYSKERHGVCPNELERRLHELLERRQQERIEELESALECAKRKVSEKEMEVRRWQGQCTTPFAGQTGSEMFSR